MKVHFTLPYDHRWPSRAVTHFPAGYTGTVKREVGNAAIAKGKATEVRRHGKAGADAAASAHTELGTGGSLAGSNDADHVGTSVQPQIVDGTGQ